MVKLESVFVEPEDKKKIFLAKSFIGPGSPDSNFTNLLKAYTLKDGKKIMGTKSVVINSGDFLRELASDYGFSENFEDLLSDEAFSENAFSDYVGFFWDNTSEVHHRDIMRNYFSQVVEFLKCFLDSFIKKENLIESDIEKAINLESSIKDCEKAIDDLYFIKKGGKAELNKAGLIMLKYSQGYQLSSGNADDPVNLNLSQILKLELSSGITKDQENYKVLIPVQEACENLDYFLRCLKNVDIKTNNIEVPAYFKDLKEYFEIESFSYQKIKEGYRPVKNETKRLFLKPVA
jgi:hypothetical protein